MFFTEPWHKWMLMEWQHISLLPLVTSILLFWIMYHSRNDCSRGSQRRDSRIWTSGICFNPKIWKVLFTLKTSIYKLFTRQFLVESPWQKHPQQCLVSGRKIFPHPQWFRSEVSSDPLSFTQQLELSNEKLCHHRSNSEKFREIWAFLVCSKMGRCGTGATLEMMAAPSRSWLMPHMGDDVLRSPDVV